MVLKFTVRPKPSFLILRKKINHPFSLLIGELLAAFFIPPKSEADVSPHGKQEKLCFKEVLVVFLTQGFLPMTAQDLPCEGSPWQACLEL